MTESMDQQHSKHSVNQKMLSVKRELEEAFLKFNEIWDDIGLNVTERTQRVDLVFMYISNLIKDMTVEEERRRTSLIESIKSLKLNLTNICEELHVEERLINEERLADQEKRLNEELEVWMKEKTERLNQSEQLRKVELALCNKMYMTPMYIPTGTVPTKDQIVSLQKQTDHLAQEKGRRYSVFIEQKTEIQNLFDDLDEEIILDFHQDVLIEDPEEFVLSEHNMSELHNLLNEMRVKHVSRKTEIDALHTRLDELWKRLDIPDFDRELFLSKIVNKSKHAVKMYRTEVDSLEQLKFEHLQEFTERIRVELVEWWAKCYYSASQKEFTGFSSEEFSEPLLQEHEARLASVKSFYEENKDMLLKIEKRTELWNRMLVLEEKEHDPNRYKNRGGNLLAEEKEKKKIISQLPKLEEQLKKTIEEWEEENGKEFRIGGVQFFDFCRNQWEEYKVEKELQKRQRMEQREMETKKEMLYGTKPNSAKRRLVAHAAPSTATPTKTRRLNNDTHMSTRSATRIAGFSHVNSVFATPATPTRAPSRPATRTPQSTRKPATVTPVRGGGCTPRTPLSTRTTRQVVNSNTKTAATTSKISKAVSERNLSKPMNRNNMMKKFKSERKLDLENMQAQTGSDSSGGSSRLETLVSSYEDFTTVLHSAKKAHFRSSVLPGKN